MLGEVSSLNTVAPVPLLLNISTLKFGILEPGTRIQKDRFFTSIKIDRTFQRPNLLYICSSTDRSSRRGKEVF